ncbi:MAG: two-component system response regulator, partial [Candidatus Schekmanbacteria bacterium RBG_16_38_10]
MNKKILIVDDEKIICEHLRKVLGRESYDVKVCHNGSEALECLKEEQFGMAVVDIKMPGMDGIELLGKIKGKYPQTSVVIMTAHGSVETAVQAMKIGAIDYLSKPFEAEEIKLVIERAFEHLKLVDENLYLRNQIAEKHRFGNIISENYKMQQIFDLIASVAVTDATVLIYGETGTGKELVAKSIHYNSNRKDEKFIAINCGAMPDTLLETELFGHEKGSFTGAIRQKIGKFELADKGTIFLDEIGNVTPAMQVKLLRVLQEMEFERVGGNKTIKIDVRIIAATNKDLKQAVIDGEFREDLYYRVNVVPINLPPLRDRLEDIPILVLHFLEKHCEKTGKGIYAFSQDVLDSLMHYHWPGNVRELENVVERAVILERGKMISKIDLPVSNKKIEEKKGDFLYIGSSMDGISLREWLRMNEKKYLVELMKRCDWNVRKALVQAKIGSKTFY